MKNCIMAFCFMYVSLCSCIGVILDLGFAERENIPKIGLLAHYKLDQKHSELVLDNTERQLTGKIIGNNLWVEAGRFAGALEFDGSNHVTVENTENLPLTALTASFWVNTQKSNNEQTLISGGNNTWSVNITPQGTIEFRGKNSQQVVSKTAIADGQWHHVSVSCHQYQAHVFIDGKLDSFRPVKGLIGNKLETFTLGSKQGSSKSNNFKGLLDEFLIYNRALSTTEIVASGYDEVIGISDSTAPAITLDKCTLHGTVEKSKGLSKFTIANQVENVDDQGNWQMEIALSTEKFPFTLQFEASDEKENISNCNLTINRDIP